MRAPIGLVALFCLSYGVVDAAEPLRVRVLCYNIHHAEGTDGTLDLARIARVIKAAAPDLVALQEVDYRTERTEDVDQAAELGRLTGLTPVAGDNIDVQGGRYGNAVLSRWKVVGHENTLLPVLSGGEQRGVLKVEVDPGDGRPRIALFSTHLDNRRADERLAAAKVINGLVAKSDQPAILAGDLNATPESEPLAVLAKEWANATAEKALPTIPVERPTRQIDFVLYRPAGAWRVVEAKVIEERVASDHRPLLVEMELGGLREVEEGPHAKTPRRKEFKT
jgi:endonuclease/exonuclease/phosphatase family metal-dependent hydrolase